jgi:hypothetical protein
MSIRVIEKIDSPRSAKLGGSGEELTRSFIVLGTTNEKNAAAAVLSATAPQYTGIFGTLKREPISIKHMGGETFEADVSYKSQEAAGGKQEDSKPPEPYEYEIDWDTTGGTIKQTVSESDPKDEGAYDGNAPPDIHRAIGWDGKQLNGCDRVIPKLAFTLKVTYPVSVLAESQVARWARETGKVNGDIFLGFNPGELLFLGCRGTLTLDMIRQTATGNVPVSFAFEASENRQNINLGNNLTVGKKDGWQYLDVRFVDVEEDGVIVPKPAYFYVWEIYEKTSMRAITGI